MRHRNGGVERRRGTVPANGHPALQAAPGALVGDASAEAVGAARPRTAGAGAKGFGKRGHRVATRELEMGEDREQADLLGLSFSPEEPATHIEAAPRVMGAVERAALLGAVRRLAQMSPPPALPARFCRFTAEGFE